MSTTRAAGSNGDKTDDAEQRPRSAEIASKGIGSSRDFRDFMSALMSDVINGAVTPSVTNAACNAGGKMLKMLELEHKYATRPRQQRPALPVAFDDADVEVGEVAGAVG